MARAWIAVASAEHVRIGRAQGFMQVCHGKGGPLRRTAAGDTVIYYSPAETMRGKDRLQAFTAIGTIVDRVALSIANGAWRPALAAGCRMVAGGGDANPPASRSARLHAGRQLGLPAAFRRLHHRAGRCGADRCGHAERPLRMWFR